MIPISSEPTRVRDSAFKLLFGDNYLCAEFIRDYVSIEALSKITEADISDADPRYVFTDREDQESDVLKHLRLSGNEDVYVIGLIEHESGVNFRAEFKLLQYMVYIWSRYEADCERERPGSTSLKDFRYPAIIPIIYFDGSGEWTSLRDFRLKVSGGSELSRFAPSFDYELVQLGKFSEQELLSKGSAISVALLADKSRTAEEAARLGEVYGEQLDRIFEQTPAHARQIIAKVIASLQRRLDIPEAEIQSFVDRISERRFSDMFAMLKPYSVQETRKQAREETLVAAVASMLAQKASTLEINRTAALIGLPLDELELLLPKARAILAEQEQNEEPAQSKKKTRSKPER